LAKLGPEPLDDQFNAEMLNDRLAGRKARLKALLLDQTVIAGLGNIYADESLFASSLHPARRACTLTFHEIERLTLAIRDGRAGQSSATAQPCAITPTAGTAAVNFRTA
jgi:formamidopyrimidine-DNA glycosylase